MTLAVGDRCWVPAVAVRWYADEPQPGLVEVVLTDRHGVARHVIGKYVYFEGLHDLHPQSVYPIDVDLDCVVIAIDGGSVMVRSLDCFDEDGEEWEFDVVADVVRRYAEEGEICELPATAVRWLAVEPQPGLVQVELLDEWCQRRQLLGKGTDFGDGTDLTPDATYPRPTRVHCLVNWLRNRNVANVTLLGPADSRGEPFVFHVGLSMLHPAGNPGNPNAAVAELPD